jgi:hypothetical protein
MLSDETKAIIADWQKSYWEAETYFHGNGFISYRFYQNFACIENYYIPTSCRGKGEGRALVFGFRDFLMENHPEIGKLMGEVQLNLPDSSLKLIMFLHFGATVYDASPDKIRVVYDIDGVRNGSNK